MTYEEACTFLFSLERRGVRLGLDRIVGAFRELGDPQESFASMLVAGTNGKGSVTALLASCLQAGGRRTGLYTSPHLIDFRERMRVDGRMIPREEVVDLLDEIRGSINRWELSYFEATTLMAFLWFRRRGVESAAIEVGLGGRLDATRPVRARVAIVTTITLDHVKILGQTRAAIAAEKGGILRADAPTVIGVSSPEAVAVLRRRAAEVGSPLHERRRSLRVTGIRQDGTGTAFHAVPRDPRREVPGAGDLRVHLAGRHQVANAAVALLALSLLPDSERPDAAAIRLGLGRAIWPARFETIRERPRVICDVAHNPEGARSLSRTLRDRGIGGVKLVMGMVEGKDHERFLKILAGHARSAHYCTPQTDRAFAGEALASIGSRLGLSGTVHATPAYALDAALAASDADDTILVTGSFYTVGEAMSHLDYAPPDPLWAAGGGDAGI